MPATNSQQPLNTVAKEQTLSCEIDLGEVIPDLDKQTDY